MSAYSRIYQGLTRGGMPAPEAAAELAALRAELGAELAAGLQAYAAEQYAAQPTDTRATTRMNKRKYGVAFQSAQWVTRATTTGRLTTTPNQRDHRSNP
ncbi:hypothetical protein [Streptomyces albipurpureus]|uniref:Transposase n=1 Tax=Streptomyces albipurpureus TaxID=2897419 RepID=A0ABT0V0Z7_9ACTN|nr:hypothetical protein [Streptomyces sp. CWNU-1]MCM2394411.1 hypothetical protein [Streptomyces sp. CWNU-1]